MSDIPKWDDTEEAASTPSWDDTAPAEAPAPDPIEATTDAEILAKSRAEVSPKGSLKQDGQSVMDYIASLRDGSVFKSGSEQVASGVASVIKGTKREDELKTLRDFNEKDRAERHERSPTAAKMGEFTGAMASPGGGKTVASRMALSTGLAGADKALQQDNWKDAGIEGAKAAALNALIAGGSELIAPAAEGIKGFANRRAVKSLDPTLAQQEGLMAKDQVQELGGELLDKGVVKFGSNVESMAPRIEEMLGAKGRRLGEIRDIADEAGATVDMSRLARKGDAKVAFSDATNEAAQGGAEAYAKNANNLARVPERSIKEAQEEVMSLNQQIPFNKGIADQTPNQQAFTELRKDITSQMDEGVHNFAPQHEAEAAALKKQFGLWKGADEITDKSVARSARNADLGIRDLIVGHAAVKKDGLAGGAKATAAALATKMARERGNTALAVSADKIAKMGKWAAPLADAFKRGPAALAATHALLSKDPEYQAQWEATESVP